MRLLSYIKSYNLLFNSIYISVLSFYFRSSDCMWISPYSGVAR